jgi:1-phosphofructokinase
VNIVTITPNPAIDQTIRLDRLVPGEVHRVQASSSRAGGKGVNVSTALAAYGIDTTASGFLGSENAGIFERHFLRHRIRDCFLRVEGENRGNIKIVDAAGTTDLNLKGMPVDAALAEKLIARAESLFDDSGGIAVLAGSLPPLCPPGFYGALTARLKARACMVLLDADGAALKNALSAEILPDCVKPNLKELSEWAGLSLGDYASIAGAARELIGRGVQLVAVSMGEEGALFIDRDRCLHAGGKPERIYSTVGAGDAMVAGIAVSLHFRVPDLENLARLSTAFALAKLESPPPPAEAEDRFRDRLEAALGRIVVKPW